MCEVSVKLLERDNDYVRVDVDIDSERRAETRSLVFRIGLDFGVLLEMMIRKVSNHFTMFSTKIIYLLNEPFYYGIQFSEIQTLNLMR